MKKRTIALLLSMALVMIAGIGFTSNLPSVDGQYSQMVATANTGGALSTKIVVDQTNLQNITQADAVNVIIAQQEASPMVGSGAQPFASVQSFADDTVNVSSGGSSFHAGKHFAPVGTDMIVTSAEKSANLDNLKGGGSFHVGKRFVASTPIDIEAATSLIIT